MYTSFHSASNGNDLIIAQHDPKRPDDGVSFLNVSNPLRGFDHRSSELHKEFIAVRHRQRILSKKWGKGELVPIAHFEMDDDTFYVGICRYNKATGSYIGIYERGEERFYVEQMLVGHNM